MQPPIVAIPYQELILRDIRVQGSVICSPDDAKEMIAMLPEMEQKLVHTTTFNGLNSIFDLVEKVSTGKIAGKAVVVVDETQL